MDAAQADRWGVVAELGDGGGDRSVCSRVASLSAASSSTRCRR
ncbi:hypothetical protein QF037_009518 [Streptomyces canus]|nr:hypothetical protein [Streptomyces canus]MDQ0605173.1 hypothetical protein [Streptomyces canus]